MTLLTAAQFREHAPSTLVDDAIQRILDAAEQEIVAYAGPTSGTVTERLRGGGSTLTTSRRVSAVTSITESRYGTDTTLAVDDWALRSPYVLERLDTGTNRRSWWYDSTIVYTPVDDTAIRKMVQIELAKLEIANNPGLAAQTIGSWTEQYAANSAWNPQEARASALSRLRELSAVVL